MNRLSIYRLAFLVMSTSGCRDGARAPTGDSTPGAESTQQRPEDAGSCTPETCAIDLVLVASLSDESEPGLLPDRLLVQQDTRKRFVTISARRDRVVVFDSLGKLMRTIGRYGAGPGEFRRLASAMIGRGDSIFAFDVENQRVSVIGPDLTFARSFSSVAFSGFQMDDGTIVVAQQIPGTGRAGFPLHGMDTSGNLQVSFGAAVPQYRSDLSRLLTRGAGPAGEESIWAAAPGRYLIERWNVRTGGLEDSLSIRPAWFTESAAADRDERTRPLPIVESVWQDQGLVWALIRVADEAWRRPDAANTHRPVTAADRDANFDWILEAIDPSRGVVLASRRLPTAHRVSPPSTLLVAMRHDDTVNVRHDVWRAHVTKEPNK